MTLEWPYPTKAKKKDRYRFSSGKIDKVRLANDILNVIREKPLCYRDIYEFIPITKSAINTLMRELLRKKQIRSLESIKNSNP